MAIPFSLVRRSNSGRNELCHREKFRWVSSTLNSGLYLQGHRQNDLQSYKNQGIMQHPLYTEMPSLGVGPRCGSFQTSFLLITGTPPIRRHCCGTVLLKQVILLPRGCLETFSTVKTGGVLNVSQWFFSSPCQLQSPKKRETKGNRKENLEFLLSLIVTTHVSQQIS